jgi:hypothetical protein
MATCGSAVANHTQLGFYWMALGFPHVFQLPMSADPLRN